ncbi:xanthine dehydrogenase family protein molybdopterin-binding subunit [uncultured Xylophilus sp.]|uniref:xanthine dehydrogenase family protein molybdopterin-binding subunit n=1 Tax=uncultured Xylophilus sp. TaxID=296832 RepID=UPI0025CFEC64|nr:xanthine dehydrogenase family protein molybdopterin-binding subunit [uncultured Xylophilus sp.]
MNDSGFDRPDITLPRPFGDAVPRVDGRAKVTGTARYAAEHFADDLAYGVVVSSTITRGRIRRIDCSAALAFPGVLDVLTHEHRLPMARHDLFHKDIDAPSGSPFRPLYDDLVHSAGQPVALVIAETFEIARHAARLVEVHYEAGLHRSDLEAHLGDAYQPSRLKLGYQPPPKPRGDAAAAFAEAPFKVAADFHAAAEYHNPMEMHASTVIYDGPGRLTIYDKTQGVQNSRMYLAHALKLRKHDIRVLAPFIGGAFGSGLRPQYQLVLAAMGALMLRRPVRVVLTRQQMFTFGHRPETRQSLKLSCDAEGRLTSIRHKAIAETSRAEDYVEIVVNWSGLLYRCDNVALDYKVVQLDRFTPLDMRAPGAVTGLHALECAVDELAAAAGVDPLEFRLRNYTDRNEAEDKPFSSKALHDCYAEAAERFGWARRTPEPGSMRDGRTRIGWGCATGVWDAMQMPGSARAVLQADGSLDVSSATADIGTGTYTVMTQIAAAALGLPLDRVRFALGDSEMPMAPIEGGSMTVATIGTAVEAACRKVAKKLFRLVRILPDAPLGKPLFSEVEFVGGTIRLKADPSRAVAFTELLQRSRLQAIDMKTTTLPHLLRQRKYTRSTHSAVFVEVRVDEDYGTVEVSRVVSAIAAGRIVNPKTAASQIEGAIVWGIGKALHEDTLHDHRLGKVMNHNLAEYHISANRDIGRIEVMFVEEEDAIVNPLGVKGVGEIGIVGVSAAIANAIWHATGRRMHALPMTPDRVRPPQAAPVGAAPVGL